MKKSKIFLFILLLIILCPIASAAVVPKEIQLTPVIESIGLPEGYNTFQGMVVTDKYFVIAAVKSDNSASVFLVYDKKNGQEVSSLSKTNTYNIGHVNDMVYYDNSLYVINQNKLLVFNKDTLEKTSEITLPISGSGIHVDNDYYYIRTDSKIEIYDKELESITSYSFASNYNKQGISGKDGLVIYNTWTGVTAIDDWEADTSLVYIYDEEGNLVSTLYTTGKGEIEALEFDDQQEYLMFQKSSVATIYTPVVTSVDDSIKIEITSNTINDSEVFKAELIIDDDEEESVEIVSENGIFTLPAYRLIDFKPHSFKVTQIDMKNELINYDMKTIEITVKARFNPITSELIPTYSYLNNKTSFNNEYKGGEDYSCKIEGNTYYNKAGYPSTKEIHDKECADVLKCVNKDGKYYDSVGKEVSESEYRASCNKNGETENPQTGGFVDGALAIAVVIMVFVIHMVLRKGKLYKIS